MSSAAFARPIPITHATEPVTTGGSTRSSFALPSFLITKPMMMLKKPVQMMPACISEMTSSGAGTPNCTLCPIAWATPR